MSVEELLRQAVSDAVRDLLPRWSLADDEGPLGQAGEADLADDVARVAVKAVREVLAS